MARNIVFSLLVHKNIISYCLKNCFLIIVVMHRVEFRLFNKKLSFKRDSALHLSIRETHCCDIIKLSVVNPGFHKL